MTQWVWGESQREDHLEGTERAKGEKAFRPTRFWELTHRDKHPVTGHLR